MRKKLSVLLTLTVFLLSTLLTAFSSTINAPISGRDKKWRK
ncbi:hypothetical protein [Bacillus sp. 7884-1]|nr:hypothetical protein [Bacillus sp. 7884-1]